jgi:hypothetical protein
MRTAYSSRAAAFSQRAHIAAVAPIYEAMFPSGVDFEDTAKTVQDLDYAIDRQLSVRVPGLGAPIRISVQERFREPQYMRFPDVTVTEWNLPSNTPSEIHKFGAQLFVYGFYDAAADQIRAAAVIDTTRLLVGLAQARLRYRREKRDGRDQSFLCFSVADLQAIGAVALVFKRGDWLGAA